MKKTLSVLILVVAFAASLSALNRLFQSTVSVSETNTVIAFTNNHSGGANQSFKPRSLLIRSDSASANTCYVDIVDSTATTADIPLAPGASISFEYDTTLVGDGFESIGAICDTGETATWYVTAAR